MGTPDPRVGVHLHRGTIADSLAFAKKADDAGIATGWLSRGGAPFDLPTFVGLAAAQTGQIRYGTSIVPAFIQHPVKLATQVRAIEEIAPGRLRLGVGTSHGPNMGTLGIPIDHALDRLREFVQVLRPLLHDGKVDFDGTYYQIALESGVSLSTPVMVSALRENAYRQAGAVSDGAISWVSPLDYLVDQMKPAMAEGAKEAGRDIPPLIAHVTVAVGVSKDEARARGRLQLAYYPTLPFYRAMFADSGFPLAEGDIEWPLELLDHLVISGDDDEIAAGLRRWLDRGVDELLVAPLTGDPVDAEDDRLLDILSRV